MTDPSTIRRQALEEVRAVLPRLSTPTMDSVWSGGWNSCVQWVEAKLDDLLAADPREASEMSDDIGQLPAKTYHDGVRACIEALKERNRCRCSCADLDKDILTALLPQPKDEAEEIQRAFERHCAETGCRFDMLEGWRWLLSQGWRAPE